MSSADEASNNLFPSRRGRSSRGAPQNSRPRESRNHRNDAYNTSHDSENLALPSTSEGTRNVVPLTTSEQDGSVKLVDLPPEILEKILKHFDYREIALLRSVCVALDKVGRSILNSGFRILRLDVFNRYMDLTPHVLVTEAAGRYDRYIAENYVIEKVHMKMKMLQKLFGKYITRGKCCFFPAQILTEVKYLLHYLEITPVLTDPDKISERMCRMTDRALRYMKSEIVPRLKNLEDSNSDERDSEEDDDYLYMQITDGSSDSSSDIDPPLCINY